MPIMGRQSIPARAGDTLNCVSPLATNNVQVLRRCGDRPSLCQLYRVDCAHIAGDRRQLAMLCSMTAYGRSQSKNDSGELVCELRSVNHRYLDITVRVPEPLRSLEATLRERLTHHLRRGKIEVALKHAASVAGESSMSINEPLLGTLMDAANRIADQAHGNSVIDAVKLLQWPGVLLSDEKAQASLTSDALSAFDDAVEDFIATRQREGAQISRVLGAKVQQLIVQINELRALRPAVVQRQREKWLEKLAQLDTRHDPSRMEQELLYVAQRLDIDEELDRLDAHCLEIGHALQRPEPVGRRLDFLMQECHREANTIAAKANDADTTNSSVNMKVLIEQIREQVQNIE